MSIAHCMTYNDDKSQCTACYDQLNPSKNGAVCECILDSGVLCPAGEVCTQKADSKPSKCVKADACFSISHCTACYFKDQSLCFKCYNGYFVSKDKTKCVSIEPCSSVVNCTSCKEEAGQESKCATCANNLTVDSNGKCSCGGVDCSFTQGCGKQSQVCAEMDACLAIPNCKSCDREDYTKCYSCNVGYERINGECVSIGACQGIPNCTSCVDSAKEKCYKCYNYLFASADGMSCECEKGSGVGCGKEMCSQSLKKCVPNDACLMYGEHYIEHCVDCVNEDQTKCFACAPGYYRSADYASCIAATCQNIAYCDQCDTTDIKKCAGCAGNLQPAADGAICECESGTGKVCDNGFICNSEHKCIAIGTCANIPHCVDCQYTEQDKCHSCLYTGSLLFFPSVDGTQCLDWSPCKGISKCATCKEDDTSKCASCQSNHVLNAELNKCECTTGSGATCASSSYCSRSQNKCVAKDFCKTDATHKIEHCVSCNNKDYATCYYCDEGYFATPDGLYCLSLATCSGIENCVACDTTNLRRCAACSNDLHPGVFGMACECEPGTQTGCEAGFACSEYQHKCLKEDLCKTTIENCEYCVNGSPERCYKCKSGYEPSPSMLICLLTDACKKGSTTIPGCTKCESFDTRKCTACGLGMVPSAFGDKCYCGTEDTVCVGQEKCVKLGIEQKCIEEIACDNVPNCYSCDKADPKICVHCNADYQPNADNTACVAKTCNIAHCVQCNEALCARCNDFLTPSLDGNTCVCGSSASACPSGQTCSSAGYCQEVGLCKNSDIYCRFCKMGDQAQCASCIDGYYPANGRCIQLGACKSIALCEECKEDDPSKCSKCKADHSLTPSGDECYCGAQGTVCSSDERCISGSCVSKDACLKSDEFCASCKLDDPTVCAACDWGYELNGQKKCVMGTNCFGIAGCKKCNFNDANKCYSCIGYLQAANGGSVCECVTGSGVACGADEVCTREHLCVKKNACLDSVRYCVACVYENQAKCYACAQGHYLNADKTECLPLSTCADIKGCSKCGFDDPTECYQCSEYLNYNAQTKKCECVPGSGVGCLTENTVCYQKQCINKNECKATDNHCLSCKFGTPTNCYECEPGYYPDSQGYCVTNEPCKYIAGCTTCQFTQTHLCHACDNQLMPGPLALSCECVPGSRRGCDDDHICNKYEGMCVKKNSCLNETRVLNCEECVPENNELCFRCKAGFVPSFEGKSCLAPDTCTSAEKIPNCSVCHSVFPRMCVECKNGNVPNASGTKCMCGGEEGIVCEEGQRCVDGACKKAEANVNKLPVGAIVGIAVGAVVVIALVGFLVFWFLRKRSAGNAKVDTTAPQPTTAGAGDADGANLYI